MTGWENHQEIYQLVGKNNRDAADTCLFGIKMVFYPIIYPWENYLHTAWYPYLHILQSGSIISGWSEERKNQPLSNAKIFLHSAKSVYFSGASYGSFGITVKNLYDSITGSMEGTKQKPCGSKPIYGKILFLRFQISQQKQTQDWFRYQRPEARLQGQLVYGDETYFQLVEMILCRFPVSQYRVSKNVNKGFIQQRTPVPQYAKLRTTWCREGGRRDDQLL